MLPRAKTRSQTTRTDIGLQSRGRGQCIVARGAGVSPPQNVQPEEKKAVFLCTPSPPLKPRKAIRKMPQHICRVVGTHGSLSSSVCKDAAQNGTPKRKFLGICVLAFFAKSLGLFLLKGRKELKEELAEYTEMLFALCHSFYCLSLLCFPLGYPGTFPHKDCRLGTTL